MDIYLQRKFFVMEFLKLIWEKLWPNPVMGIKLRFMIRSVPSVTQ